MAKTTKGSESGKQQGRPPCSQGAGSAAESDIPRQLLGLLDARLFGVYFFSVLAALSLIRVVSALGGALTTPGGSIVRAVSDPFVYPLNHLLQVSPAARFEAGSFLGLALYVVATIGIVGIPDLWTTSKVREEQAG